jgi:Uma2 family endonuclease
MTYEDFLAGAYDGIKAEWVEGTVITMSPASSDHQEMTLFLLTALGIYVQAKQLGTLRFERFQVNDPRRKQRGFRVLRTDPAADPRAFYRASPRAGRCSGG